MNKNDIGNYMHNCIEKKVNLNKCKKGLENTKLTKMMIAEIYTFYLKFSEEQKPFEKYLWRGMSDENGLNKLESLLLQASEIQSFCMLKSNSIDETIKKMDLYEKICFLHPRSVIKLDTAIEYTEDGVFKFTKVEIRMNCLIRHIRNSLAHNQIYVFDNDMILLEDKNEKEGITARILIKSETLYKWMKIIKREK